MTENTTLRAPEGSHAHGVGHGHEPVISQRWKWMTVLGNAAIGACELLTGNTSTLAVTSDGLHNVGDTATYYMQAENILNPNLTEQRRVRMRKIAHWLIAGMSAGIGIKAGIDLSLDHEGMPNPGAVYTASASLALNSLMLARLRGNRTRHGGHATEHEHDLAKHFWAVDIPSAGLALGGAILQKYNVEIEQVAAVASGAVGACAFRPTKKNLAHNCLDHGHAAHTEPHESDHDVSAPLGWFARLRSKSWHDAEQRRAPSRLRRAIGRGTTALALMGGLLGGDAHPAQDEADLHTLNEQPSISAAIDKQMEHTRIGASLQAILTSAS